MAEGARDGGEFSLSQGEDAGFAFLAEGEGRSGMGLALGAMAVGLSAAAAQEDEGAAQRGDGIEGDHKEGTVAGLGQRGESFWMFCARLIC